MTVDIHIRLPFNQLLLVDLDKVNGRDPEDTCDVINL
jgi:hypothetical protein